MATKTISLRWAGACSRCGSELPAGTKATWDGIRKEASCLECPSIDRGEAGRSAAREYERRAARERRSKQRAIEQDAQWRADVVAARPVLGRLQSALTPKPTMGPESHGTRAWKTGAEGEERVGGALEACPSAVVLHDRRVPGSKANIDHIAVAPTGVYVVDAKRYTGAVEARDAGSFFRPDWRLYVGGRNCTKLVTSMLRQLDVVRTALAQPDVPVHGVLCFTGAEWPLLLARPVVVDGVVSLWPKALQDRVERPGALSREAVESIAAGLARELAPA